MKCDSLIACAGSVQQTNYVIDLKVTKKKLCIKIKSRPQRATKSLSPSPRRNGMYLIRVEKNPFD